jgi:hypothetical protein
MIVAGVNLLPYDSITTMIIPQIMACSFLTSLVTTAYFSYNPKKPITVPVRILLSCAHYLVLCVIVMTLGVQFEWFHFHTKGVIFVVLSVAGVYFITALISYILSKGEANEMTNALKNYKDE